MSVDWYWLNPDKTVSLGPRHDDKDEFARYSIWLYGNGNDGTPNKHVGRDDFGSVLVSTVFLGLDHSFGGPPVLFETMIFDANKEDREMERYCTWDEAVAGHERWCKRFRKEPVMSPEFTLDEIHQSQVLLKKD